MISFVKGIEQQNQGGIHMEEKGANTVRIILLGFILIYFIVSSISKGVSFLTILVYIPFAISIFAAVFGGSQGIMFIGSLVSGVLACFLSRNIALSVGIASILIFHTVVYGD